MNSHIFFKTQYPNSLLTGDLNYQIQEKVLEILKEKSIPLMQDGEPITTIDELVAKAMFIHDTVVHTFSQLQ